MHLEDCIDARHSLTGQKWRTGAETTAKFVDTVQSEKPADPADEMLRRARSALSTTPRKISSRVVQSRGAVHCLDYQAILDSRG
jgi:hypothetical protein